MASAAQALVPCVHLSCGSKPEWTQVSRAGVNFFNLIYGGAVLINFLACLWCALPAVRQPASQDSHPASCHAAGQAGMHVVVCRSAARRFAPLSAAGSGCKPMFLPAGTCSCCAGVCTGHAAARHPCHTASIGITCTASWQELHSPSVCNGSGTAPVCLQELHSPGGGLRLHLGQLLLALHPAGAQEGLGGRRQGSRHRPRHNAMAPSALVWWTRGRRTRERERYQRCQWPLDACSPGVSGGGFRVQGAGFGPPQSTLC